MNNNKIYENVSILVVGYDGYKDVWDHFFTLINKYWKDRPKTYLATSELVPVYENVTVLPAGKDSEWSKRAYNALTQIDTDYVILMLEDFFITKFVDNDIVEGTLQEIITNKIKFYQLQSPNYNRDKKIGTPYKGNEYVRVIPQNKDYVLNLQTVIWNREYLLSVIGKENYNAWIFEFNNIHHTDINVKRTEYLIDVRNVLNITHAIVQSKYLRGAIKYLKKINYTIDTTERPTFTIMDQFKYDLKTFVSDHAPECLVPFLKKIGKLMKVDFVSDRVLK